jgi:hypothetical protein
VPETANELPSAEQVLAALQQAVDRHSKPVELRAVCEQLPGCGSCDSYVLTLFVGRMLMALEHARHVYADRSRMGLTTWTLASAVSGLRTSGEDDGER